MPISFPICALKEKRESDDLGWPCSVVQRGYFLSKQIVTGRKKKYLAGMNLGFITGLNIRLIPRSVVHTRHFVLFPYVQKYYFSEKNGLYNKIRRFLLCKNFFFFKMYFDIYLD